MEHEFIPLSVPNFAGNEKEYVLDAVVSEWVSTGGSKVAKFEDMIAEYAGVPQAVACASGTAGLHLALLVAGIGQNDEVIAPALTFIAAVNPISYVGAYPVFIGCDYSLCIDPDAIEAFCCECCTVNDGVLYNKNSGRPVRGIMAVHIFGNMYNMPRLVAIAKKYRLKLIEDATEALGSHYISGQFTGRMAGTMGDVGVYSFNGNKIITTGSGGMLLSPHGDWAKHARHLSTQAKTSEVFYTHDAVGYNYRMTNLQAALGLAQLEQLEGFIKRKNEIYAMYVDALDGKKGLRILPFGDDIRSNCWFFSLYIEASTAKKSRDDLHDALAKEGIQTRTIWGLINDQAPYLHCEAFALSTAKDYQNKVLNLPCSTNLKVSQIDRICNEILGFF